MGNFKAGELLKDSVVKDFLTTASDGKNYKTKYYNLDVVISVGYYEESRQVKAQYLCGFPDTREAVFFTIYYKFTTISFTFFAYWRRKTAIS